MTSKPLTLVAGGCRASAAKSWGWFVAGLLAAVFATPGCRSDRSGFSRRLAPEDELQVIQGDETPPKPVDPTRLSRQELEARDGDKALDDAERNGVDVRD